MSWRRQPRCCKTAAISGVMLVVVGVVGCTTVADPRTPRDPVGEAVAQPFRDLSLVHDELPEGLRKAAAEPYRPACDCAAIQAEIEALGVLLGPDVDVPGANQDAAVGLLADVVTEATSLPYRRVVRRFSGAYGRDRAQAAIVLAARVRRGFLKGERAALGCAASDS